MRLFKLKTAFAVFSLCLAITMQGATKKVTIDDIEYSVNTTDKRAQVKGRSTEATKKWKLKVPDELSTEWGKIKVTSIANDAFFDDEYLTAATLSNNIETIGSQAFFGCSALKTVTVGVSLRIVGYRAFSNSGITSIEFPASLEIIRDEAFMAARSLKEVVFDRNTAKLESIGRSAFWYTALESIFIPGCVKTIEEDAFNDCEQLVSVTFLPGDGKTNIVARAFNNVKSLKMVTFGNPGVESIGVGAFVGCSITELAFPASLRTIGNYAFDGNDLVKLTFSEGLVTIGNGAFSNQSTFLPGMILLDKMTTLVLPSTLKSIGEKAFYSVSNDLESVTSLATLPPVALEKAFDPKTQNNAILYVHPSSLNAYKGANEWKDFYTILPIGSAGIDGTIAEEEAPEYFNISGVKVNPEDMTNGVYIKKTGKKIEKIVK